MGELASASAALKRTQELSDQKQVSAEELVRAERIAKAMQVTLDKAQTDLALAKTQFEAAKRELRLHLIRTPNSGTVSEIHAKVGDHVQSSGPLMVISD